MSTTLTSPQFREGDEVVLAEGSHQGTLGRFLRVRDDPNWADISERSDDVRSHPIAWLAHSTEQTPGIADWRRRWDVATETRSG